MTKRKVTTIKTSVVGLEIKQSRERNNRILKKCVKAQVVIVGGVLPGFVTRMHKDSVRRWNLWFPSAGVFAEVLTGRAMRMQITCLPNRILLTHALLNGIISNDLEWLSKIFNGMKHRAASPQWLSFLLKVL